MKIGIIGASIDVNNTNMQAIASDLGVWLAKNNHIMVYSGEASGLVRTVLENIARSGGKSIHQAGLSIDDILTEVDAFVFLPGGIDVFNTGIRLLNLCEEGIFSKPFLLLNIDDFWVPLEQLIGKMESEHYISKKPNNVFFCNNLNTIADIIK